MKQNQTQCQEDSVDAAPYMLTSIIYLNPENLFMGFRINLQLVDSYLPIPCLVSIHTVTLLGFCIYLLFSKGTHQAVPGAIYMWTHGKCAFCRLLISSSESVAC